MPFLLHIIFRWKTYFLFINLDINDMWSLLKFIVLNTNICWEPNKKLIVCTVFTENRTIWIFKGSWKFSVHPTAFPAIQANLCPHAGWSGEDLRFAEVSSRVFFLIVFALSLDLYIRSNIGTVKHLQSCWRTLVVLLMLKCGSQCYHP